MTALVTAPCVLILDDDPEITSAIARGLQRLGYETSEEQQVATALEQLREKEFDAAVIDVMIGADSGLDLVRLLRREGNRTPVVMLSALSTVEDRTAGLEAGANDYVVKPFSFSELSARLKVQERRATDRRARLDRSGRQLRSGSRTVGLTEREFALLAVFASHPGEPLSRSHLFDLLWAAEGASAQNVVDVYVGALRRKLSLSKDFGFEIQTVRNRGFQLAGVPPEIM